jgi:hypothetical protein
MKLIEEWKQAWKMFSVQASAIGIAIPAVYLQLPDDFKATIPHHWIVMASAITAACGLVGRLIQQTPKDEAPK